MTRRERVIATLLERAARWHAARVAIVDVGTGRRVTFRELRDRSVRLANALLAIAPGGARVALLMPNRVEFLEWDLAIAIAGMVKVPINPRLADEERRWILERSGAAVLVADASFEAFVAATRDALPVPQIVAVGGAIEGARSHEALIGRASAVPPAVTRGPGDPSFILFTSGTTGRPKGATSSVRGRIAGVTSMLANEIDPSPRDVMIHAGHLSHGSGQKALTYHLRGATNLLLPKFDPEIFFWAVREHGGSASFLVPTMIAMLAAAPGTAREGISALRTISYGGAPIAPARLREAVDAFGPIFVQVYGSCEAPHPVTVLRKDEHVGASDERLASAGREVLGIEMRIVGPDGTDVPDGEPGEIWVRGDQVMLGYWDDHEATAAAIRGGWYRTGDVGRRDGEGYLHIIDRERDLIISGGLNVYPAEVEAALVRHPAVAESAVIGVPDDLWGESVKAFVVLRPGASASSAELVEHCRGLLAGYKKPRTVELVASLPKGTTGKVLKRELRRAYWEGRERAVV